eukprot:1157595-Pelagomonas_calceolata.AAC.7
MPPQAFFTATFSFTAVPACTSSKYAVPPQACPTATYLFNAPNKQQVRAAFRKIRSTCQVRFQATTHTGQARSIPSAQQHLPCYLGPRPSATAAVTAAAAADATAPERSVDLAPQLLKPGFIRQVYALAIKLAPQNTQKGYSMQADEVLERIFVETSKQCQDSNQPKNKGAHSHWLSGKGKVMQRWRAHEKSNTRTGEYKRKIPGAQRFAFVRAQNDVACLSLHIGLDLDSANSDSAFKVAGNATSSAAHITPTNVTNASRMS